MQTERDAQIVDWLGRIGLAGAEHVSECFGMSRYTVYTRLRLLAADGLVAHRMILYGRPGMYWATAHGLRWQGLGRLGVVQISPGGFEHAWQVAAVAVLLRRELPGWQMFAEREIKALEIDEGRPFASAEVGHKGSRAVFHRPDLAVLSPSGRMAAIEVELSVKWPRELARICRGWARARHVEHVYYLATPAASRAVRRALEAVKATDRVSVLDLPDLASLAARELSSEEAPDGRPA